MRRVAAIVVVLATALIALIAWRIHAQSEAERGPSGGTGVIEAHGIDLASRLSARVLRVSHAEGQAVAAGEVLIELDCAEPAARLAEAEGRLAAARAQAAAAQALAKAALGQRAAAVASIDAQGAQAAALAAQRELAARDAERFDSMGEHAAFSVRDRARATAAGLSEQERAALAAQTISRRQAGAARAQAESAQAQADAARASVAALQALVASARTLVDECTLRAPRAGVLERVYYDAGELVAAGTPMVRLVDPNAIELTFYLANTDVEDAALNGPAEVRADAYPERVFAATVERVAREAEFTPRNVQTRSDRDRLVYPVELRVDDPHHLLRTGMQATATLRARVQP